MIAFSAPVMAQQEPKNINKSEIEAVEKSTEPSVESTGDDVAIETKAIEQAQQPVQEKRQSIPAKAAVTCEQAIRQVWPQHLQDGAILVSKKENAPQDPAAVGATNQDTARSTDYGCFQINDYWHPAYFTEGDWKDPVWAAKYALRIYEGRQRLTGNGWEAWYAVQGILW